MGKMIQKLFLAAAAVLWCFDTTHADANANATLFTWVSESVGGGGGEHVVAPVRTAYGNWRIQQWYCRRHGPVSSGLGELELTLQLG